MSKTRVEIVQENLTSFLRNAVMPGVHRLADDAPLHAKTSLTAKTALGIFEDQITSRLLDVAARELRKTNQSFYTISSAGHEQNAVIGALLRLDDPCFLHYRSGALVMARARQKSGENPLLDTALSFCASADDPISHGRHKVWGSRALWIPPQTSTIASHLPKAAGMAFALRTARKQGLARDLSDDSIVLCSFGDASANHATALTGINAARYTVRRGGTAPILFLCEDNGIGISVETPRNWIHDSFSQQPHLTYFEADGAMDDIWNVTSEAINYCRRRRAPVFLHLHCVRLWGHAGTDVETGYRTLEEIEAIESHDPLLKNAKLLIDTGAARPQELLALLENAQRRVDDACAEAVKRPKLTSIAEIVRPLAPYDEAACRAAHQQLPSATASNTGRKNMAANINAALADAMEQMPEIIVFGEDVGRKGGVYFVTGNLQKRFGTSRCFDTLLDETTILGVAQGAAMTGLLPIPEIQYLAYLHNALDQLRGEACSLSYFSAGQFANPMVVRVQGLAYQKGFGGHFHNDNSVGALRDIPGLLLAAPARGDEAAMMLRGLIAAAKTCGRVAVFLEPIALYHEKDLSAEGDSEWLFEYPAREKILLPGEVGIYHPQARDVLIISYANGLRLSLRAARRLQQQGISARVMDVRWLNPLPLAAIHAHASECERVLIADECRATGGGIADAVIAALMEAGYARPMHSVRSVDTYIPLAAAANLVLLSEEQIVQSARAISEGREYSFHEKKNSRE